MAETKRDEYVDEKRCEMAAAAGNIGVWDLDLDTDGIYFSPQWKTLLGYEETEIGGKADDWFRLVHPSEIHNLKAVLDSHLQGFTDSFEIEYRILSKSKEYEWVLCRGIALRDKGNRPYRILGSQISIDRFKQTEKQLIENALHDPVTGLSGRVLFMDYLQRARTIINRYKERHFAVFSLGIGQFNQISKSLGAAAGNQFLCEIASRLKGILRPSDVLARFDGDVFAVLIEDFQDISYSVRIAERIKQVISMPLTLNGREIVCRASIGIVISSSKLSQTGEFLQNADTARRRAADLGGDRYEIFDQTVRMQVLAPVQLEAALRGAIERDEFTIYYQPIVSMKTGAITCCEAFLRWHHPELGFVPAAEFIKVAEDSGLIIFLGNRVLKNASDQVKAWHMAGLPHIGVSVNISAFQFKQKNLRAIVTDVLKESRLEPQYLRLELSEKAVMENAGANTAALQSLKDLGISLSLDDFGTGCSSLEYLERFPFDQLKIDLSIIRGIPQKADSKAITSAIISLAHSLNLTVTAEGVENSQQLKFLAEKGCEEFQGALIAMPMANENMIDFLRKNIKINLESLLDAK
jgi:diguanylate cyclase (GGDEF)-like protein/PAS domain S-box-containing protein